MTILPPSEVGRATLQLRGRERGDSESRRGLRDYRASSATTGRPWSHASRPNPTTVGVDHRPESAARPRSIEIAVEATAGRAGGRRPRSNRRSVRRSRRLARLGDFRHSCALRTACRGSRRGSGSWRPAPRLGRPWGASSGRASRREPVVLPSQQGKDVVVDRRFQREGQPDRDRATAA